MNFWKRLKYWQKGMILNLSLILIWIFLGPRFVNGFAFELLSYFITAYFLIILIISLRIKKFKDKLIFSYSAFSLLIAFSIFLIFIEIDRETITLFLSLMGIPLFTGFVTTLIGLIIEKLKNHRQVGSKHK